MKGRAAEKLLMQVAERLHSKQLGVTGSLLFKRPVGDVLCGLLLESSGFSATVFQPIVFVQPMFQKTSHLVLSLGERFLGNWNSADNENVDRLVQHMTKVGMPFWDRYDSKEQLASLPLDPRRPLQSITRGYALALCRRFDEATRVLKIADEQQTKIYREQMKADPSFWPNILHIEVTAMIDKIQHDPESSLKTLDAWRRFTLDALHLTEYTE